jgi:hypothetical protein
VDTPEDLEHVAVWMTRESDGGAHGIRA